eukprot:1159162-Pelagomonas_calceolata.AAC.4
MAIPKYGAKPRTQPQSFDLSMPQGKITKNLTAKETEQADAVTRCAKNGRTLAMTPPKCSLSCDAVHGSPGALCT